MERMEILGGKTNLERIDDLEHDNNVLRLHLADLQTENTRLSMEFEKVIKRVNALCAKIDDFVGRFQKVN